MLNTTLYGKHSHSLLTQIEKRLQDTLEYYCFVFLAIKTEVGWMGIDDRESIPKISNIFAKISPSFFLKYLDIFTCKIHKSFS